MGDDGTLGGADRGRGLHGGDGDGGLHAGDDRAGGVDVRRDAGGRV